MDEKKAWVLWPEYFDAGRTRASGRKVKKELAVPNPTLEMLEKAVKRLGAEYAVQAEKSYPGAWYDKKGRILVEKTLTKSQLLVKVGESLVRSQRS
ncbi:MAG: signal recognition particle subunit SRP19/SEC65 family protein [Methanomassiliicoccales archaeon]|jgi:signal recognition particle subunit SRP19